MAAISAMNWAPLDDWDTIDRPRPRRRPASASLLSDIATGLARSVSLDLLPQGEGRRYARVVGTPAYEAWLIAWPHRTGLALHDHGGSEASIVVLRGRLRERYRSTHGLAVRWLGVGDHVELPADHVHEIVNVDATEAVSLHVYGPRLGTLGFHTADQELAL